MWKLLWSSPINIQVNYLNLKGEKHQTPPNCYNNIQRYIPKKHQKLKTNTTQNRQVRIKKVQKGISTWTWLSSVFERPTRFADGNITRRKGQEESGTHSAFSILLTVILTLFHSWFLLPFLLDFVSFLVNDLKDSLGHLLLPSLRHDEGEIFVELLVWVCQLEWWRRGSKRYRSFHMRRKRGSGMCWFYCTTACFHSQYQTIDKQDYDRAKF